MILALGYGWHPSRLWGKRQPVPARPIPAALWSSRCSDVLAELSWLGWLVMVTATVDGEGDGPRGKHWGLTTASFSIDRARSASKKETGDNQMSKGHAESEAKTMAVGLGVEKKEDGRARALLLLGRASYIASTGWCVFVSIALP